jgi:hypothetical protein
MRSFLAGAAVAVLLAGCGTARAQSGTVHAGGRPQAAVVASGGSRAQAQAYVRRLIAELSLPEGAKPAQLKQLPQIMRAQSPGTTGWAGASRILIVPGQPLAVLKRISGHPPFNEPVIYEATPVMDSTMRAAPEPGINVVILDLAVQARSRTTTLVGAYAFAAWLPYRTVAEHLDPATFRAVTIIKDQIVSTRQRTVSRTFTSPAVIARFAAFLNGRTPAPESAVGALSCPAPFLTYALRFTARDGHGPAVTASASCWTIAIRVNGKQQPLLWDTGDGLETIARSLAG